MRSRPLSPVAAVVPSNPQSGISCPVSPELALSEGFGEKFPSQNLEAREEARHDRFFFSRCSSWSREDRQWTTGETETRKRRSLELGIFNWTSND